MEVFDFKGFCVKYSLTVKMAALVFNISTRTVKRWRQKGRICAKSAALAMTIEEGSPPWSPTFGRGYRIGALAISTAWRVRFFGEKWAAHTMALDKPARERAESRAAAGRALLANNARQQRQARAARAVATRKANQGLRQAAEPVCEISFVI